MGEKYDFGGWATKNDLKCSDGRTIRKNAFADQNGEIVPLVWQHMHDSPENVLGHALLENREDGVYAYGVFNDTPYGQNAKMLVQHGDISDLSIHANQLKQMGGDVLHGKIREVSLVLAGANPGASIDYPILEHGEEAETEAIIYTGEGIDNQEGEIEDMANNELEHADKETIKDVFETLSEKQKNAVYAIIGQLVGDKNQEDDEELEHSSEEDESISEIFESLTDKQKDAVYTIVGEIMDDEEDEEDGDDDEDEDNDEDNEELEHSDEEGSNIMKKNVFEGDAAHDNSNVLTHADMAEIFRRAKSFGSLREAVNDFTENQGIELMHDDTDSAYGIQKLNSKYSDTTYGIDMLFPEYRATSNVPEFLSRNMDWVNVVMNGVSHSPFTRIKSLFADITEDEARAKGYIKNHRKKEEVFTLLKRTTDPQTVYKKQKLDRDDIIDITDFDVVAWLKGEMRMMLNEEIARAILIGDGRLPSSDDKIQEAHIRPITTDDDLFTIKVKTTSDPAEQIKAVIRARKQYKGSGSPVMFTTEDVLTEMLLLEDKMGHTLYKTEQELATKLRVSRIVPVEAMENQKVDGNDLFAVIVNLKDYRVGTDKGGQVSLFDDFDIDYNQQKYLMETRMSGALVKPFSAMVITAGGSANTNTQTEEEPEG